MANSMHVNSSRVALVCAFALCLLAAGIPFWRIPYSEVNVPDGFYGIGLFTVFASSLLLRASGRAGFGMSLVVPGLALPTALMLRVLVEATIEPSRHNLWPLALAIVLVMGFATSGAGALAGWLLWPLWPRGPGRN